MVYKIYYDLDNGYRKESRVSCIVTSEQLELTDFVKLRSTLYRIGNFTDNDLITNITDCVPICLNVEHVVCDFEVF